MEDYEQYERETVRLVRERLAVIEMLPFNSVQRTRLVLSFRVARSMQGLMLLDARERLPHSRALREMYAVGLPTYLDAMLNSCYLVGRWSLAADVLPSNYTFDHWLRARANPSDWDDGCLRASRVLNRMSRAFFSERLRVEATLNLSIRVQDLSGLMRRMREEPICALLIRYALRPYRNNVLSSLERLPLLPRHQAKLLRSLAGLLDLPPEEALLRYVRIDKERERVVRAWLRLGFTAPTVDVLRKYPQAHEEIGGLVMGIPALVAFAGAGAVAAGATPAGRLLMKDGDRAVLLRVTDFLISTPAPAPAPYPAPAAHVPFPQ